MAPVKEKWSTEYRPTIDEVELHFPEEWDRELHRDDPIFHKQRSVGLWTALASLAVVLAVLAAYGYSVARNQNAQLSWLPGLMKSISSVRDRTNNLESNLKGWSTKQGSLAARVQKLDTGWDARLEAVRRHAAELVSNAYQREQAELNQRTAGLKAQIAEMTSHQQADRLHLAKLEQELANARQELASMRDNQGRELAALQQQQASTQEDVASLNDLLSTDQVDFEARKDRDEEIVSGISFHLTGTDVAHQRFRGWIWLAEGTHRIWFRRQALESPVVFYSDSGDEAYELVVTRVNQKDVAGYLLIPSGSNPQQAKAAQNNKTIAKASQGSL